MIYPIHTQLISRVEVVFGSMEGSPLRGLPRIPHCKSSEGAEEIKCKIT
jgi:hypothetical protein